MTNPKNGSTLASWQLISIGAGSVVILGLAGFGVWNLLAPRSNTSQSTTASQPQGSVQQKQNSPSSQPQDAATQKLIGQWQAKETRGSKERTLLIVFAPNDKAYLTLDGTAIEGTYQIASPDSKPQKITLIFGDPFNQSRELELIDERNLVSLPDRVNLQKISDKGVLPDGTKFATPSPRTLQAEARNNVGTVNRAQQAVYLEKNRFASNTIEAGLGTPEDTKYYKYTMAIVDEKRMVWFIATPKTEGAKSYIGITKVISTNNQTITRSVACESLQPTANVAPKPSNAGRETGYPACPDGYRDLSN